MVWSSRRKDLSQYALMLALVRFQSCIVCGNELNSYGSTLITGRSLIYTRKRSHPKHMPCGTTLKTGAEFDVYPLHTTLCNLSCKKDVIQWRVCPFSP